MGPKYNYHCCELTGELFLFTQSSFVLYTLLFFVGCSMASEHKSLIVCKDIDVIKVQKRYQCLCLRNQHVTVPGAAFEGGAAKLQHPQALLANSVVLCCEINLLIIIQSLFC